MLRKVDSGYIFECNCNGCEHKLEIESSAHNWYQAIVAMHAAHWVVRMVDWKLHHICPTCAGVVINDGRC